MTTLVGSALLLANVRLPLPLATCEYLALGWGALLCYMQMARVLSHRALAPLVDRAWVTALSGTVSEDPEAIRAHLTTLGVKAEVVADAGAGLEALLAAGGGSVRLVAGSFYLVGPARAAMRDDPRPANRA